MREDLLEATRCFGEFDRSTLALCEPLRAHAHRLHVGMDCAAVGRPVVSPAFPNFRDTRYWMQEYEILVAIAEALRRRLPGRAATQ